MKDVYEIPDAAMMDCSQTVGARFSYGHLVESYSVAYVACGRKNVPQLNSWGGGGGGGGGGGKRGGGGLDPLIWSPKLVYYSRWCWIFL